MAKPLILQGFRPRRYKKISEKKSANSFAHRPRNKAANDKFEYIDGDHLGGIFTNKEKSIYYFIFLSENNPVKAQNACRVLNIAFGK